MKYMFKKSMAIILSFVLLLSLAVPAMAENLDKDLERVTLIVKKTLGIDNSYTEFTGDLSDGGEFSYWNLYWSKDDESLRVSADKNGKVMSYYLNSNDYTEPKNGYSPEFSKTNKEDALKIAKEFVGKVLGTNETVTFNDNSPDFVTYEVKSYYFNGTILLNGLKSPISFNINVNTDEMRVSSFRRSDLYDYYSNIPSATPKTTNEAAYKLLTDNLELELQYVLSEDGKTAVLQYLPVDKGDYIVNAQTGKLEKLEDIFYGADSENAAGSAVPATAEKGLSDVEKDTVAVLEGVYSKEELDKSVREITELGLNNDIKLNSANYSMNKEDGTVTCYLNYTKNISDKNVIKKMFPEYYDNMQKTGIIYPINIYKYIAVDAKTKGLISISTYNSYEEKAVLNEQKLTQISKDFLTKKFNDKFSLTALYKNASTSNEGTFVYAQSVNNILFPTNAISISVNTYDGTIDTLYINWTDAVKFDSAEGIVNAETAKAAYINSFKSELQYVAIPSNDKAIIEKYGYRYNLLLAYKLESSDNITGIDAKTGKPIIYNYNENEPIVYDDINNCYGKKQIEALAEYGIGFSGSKYMPTAKLTQKDALVLLLSAVGYRFNGEDAEDDLYNTAYYNNLLTKEERKPDKILTRLDFIKMLVGATEYGPSAKLSNIFKTGFADETSIPAKYIGYVAIAKALGIVNGDSNNKINANGNLTRQDAAIMLYNFMSR